MHPDYMEGTLEYIAPEQTGRMNRPVDYRCDYYSLGVTIYELFLNQCPFKTSDSMEMVHLHLASMPLDLHDQDRSIPNSISKVVQKLIAKNAENRYQSSVGICKDIEASLLALDTPTLAFTPGKYDVSDKLQIPSKLYGRSAEIKRLIDAYEYVCDGNSAVVLVTGYSGIGKSALIHEIHKPIAKRHGFFITGKFDQYRRDIPYSALIQAFTSLIQQILTESDDRIAYWRGRIIAILGESSQLIMDVVPDLKYIIGEQPPLMPLEPQEAQNRFNYNFVNFVKIFAQAEHPLTLFLDDLQWADNPSLHMLELLSTNSNCNYQMIIGTYRHNEVEAAHPMQLTLNRMRNGGVWIDELSLQPLQPAVVAQILSDTFSCDAQTAQPLADLVFTKTAGNSFFINQLLKNMHRNKLIYYDYPEHQWIWDITQIGQVAISDNVIELLTNIIRTLPDSTQQLLKLAACIGNSFSLELLSVVSQRSKGLIATELHIALNQMLIAPVGNEYKYFGNAAPLDGEQSDRNFDVTYRFMHDRIQQAASDQLSDAENGAVHFKIGSLLLENVKDPLLAEKLFDIVNHFSQSIEMVVDPALRLRLAKLTMMAAGKAKKSIAYESALKYIMLAEHFLGDHARESPQLLFAILVERAECEQLNGNRDVAEAFYLEAQKRAVNRDEKVVVLEAMIHFYTNNGEFDLAYRTGRQALKLFGITLTASFIPPLFVADLLKLKWHMRGRKISELIMLPICQDAEKVTAMRLIGALLKAAYQIRPELCIANAVKAVNLSLKHGTMEDNAVAYIVFGGIFIGGVMGKHQAGYEFAQLAIAMNDRFDNLKQRSEVNFVSGYFTDFWLNPARHTEEYYLKAYENGLQYGDYFHLSCAACTMVQSQFIRGLPLAEVEKTGREYLAFVERINNHESAGTIMAALHTIQNLKGLTENPCSFAKNSEDEEQFIKTIHCCPVKDFAVIK
ncbi:MAG: hypothetical protein COW18_14170 [Zetaproteobacteria bacterium CG12_big_fil_rev_8_21_14_0_65_54_13]|nr:MAG: hypothetical protein COW18_14170 [Zetaproteobacteria bacterium CG12_big_fil_rev_8_21_14_0_65_54_13]